MQIEEFLQLTINQLEERTNINKGTLSKYFKLKNPDNPSWKTILTMSKCLDMTADQVMEAIKAKRKQKLDNLKDVVAEAQRNIVKIA